MTTLISRNTVQLAATASSVNDYYNGYTIEFTRLYKTTGKKAVQRQRIIDYDGASKIATIGGLWLEDVVPGVEDSIKKDTYRIIPTYADKRCSINPAIQALDYICSNRYGRGLDAYRDLYLPSWLESARLCDAQSDVTVETNSSLTGLTVGARYKYPASGDILFQGDVTAINTTFVTFTNVLGKLTNKWNSWKAYGTNAIVYDEGRTYMATSAGPFPTKPTHTSGTVNALQFLSTVTLTKVTGSGPATITLPADGNPVRNKKNGAYITGYSLYDADGVDYWRYLGWDEHSQRNATQCQTNLTIDTSEPLFDNMNSLLQHFGGMLRYNAGKYYLEVEDAEGGISSTNDPRHITTDDILSKIRISDDGIRSSYNSLTVAFADPANKFEARNISFFNSDYLKADRNVAKKGNLSIPGITSYYNARLLAERYLVKSRFGLTVSFNMSPKGALLLAGRVIEIPYARYGWTAKKFRITDMTHNTDTTVDVVAEEYDDSFYQIKAVMQRPGVGKAADSTNTSVASPTNLRTTNITTGNEVFSGIELKWDNADGLDPTNITTQVYSSGSPHYYITITTIGADTQTLTSNVAHGLAVGDTISVSVTTNGLSDNMKYYVIEVPSTTTFKLSTQRGGTSVTLSAGTVNIQATTAVLIQELPYPENTFFDAYVGSTNASRISKYYWIRYKIY